MGRKFCGDTGSFPGLAKVIVALNISDGNVPEDTAVLYVDCKCSDSEDEKSL